MEHRLLCVLAHPDDESLGLGGILARAAADGVGTYLVTATSGEQGWPGAPGDHPGPQRLAQVREAELRAAATILGVRGLTLLRYPDGGLAELPAAAVVARLTRIIREIRPQVVVTFGPDGATGHPDHMAICQLTTAAVFCAADGDAPEAANGDPHRVAKLYYMAPTRAQLDRYDQVFGDSAMTVDGITRRVPGWPDWAISAQIDATPYVQQVWQAINCHRSQLPLLATLGALPQATHAALWGTSTLYRVVSQVTAPRNETDLFSGLYAPTMTHADAY
jgi:LmbE family N-acetylglucosaminyl deacetylase